MPNKCSASTNRARAASSPPLSTKLNRPQPPVKSRVHRSWPAEPGRVVGRHDLAERLRLGAQLAVKRLAGRGRAHHQVRMAADMLGQAHDRNVAAALERGEAERA